MLPRTPLRTQTLVVFFALVVFSALALGGCGGEQETPLRIAVMMPLPPTFNGALPNITLALEKVNAAGGIDGRELVVDYQNLSGQDDQQDAQQVALALAADAEHDAFLLLAYGLQASGGLGGKALIDGMKSLVNSNEGGPHAWDAVGVDGALFAIKAIKAIDKGSRPALLGAGGPFDVAPVLSLVHGNRRPRVEDAKPARWAPTASKTDAWAVIAALSSGWENYRHQADALRQYQLLKKSGMADDHIILIMADDLAAAKENPLPGTVRNETDGENLHVDVKVDYDLRITGSDLRNIIAGNPSSATPTVVEATAGSNLYIYLVGHGGTQGLSVGANSTAAGLSGQGSVFSPAQLRAALCSRRSRGELRRGLVVVESCYGGAFGDAAYGGLEEGCSGLDGATPLEGVALISAANSREASVGGSYDLGVRTWVNDVFSDEFAGLAARASAASVVDTYVNVYLRVSGSHASLYNATSAGALDAVPIGEFWKP